MSRLSFLCFPILSIFILFSAHLFAEDSIALHKIADELSFPVYITNANDGSDRLFIVEKRGKVKIFKDGDILEVPFLDLESRVFSKWESGLLSIAFHPEFSENGRIFVDYIAGTDDDLRSVIAEYHVSGFDPDAANDDERVIIEISQNHESHNGGQLQFGVDGNLYISLGDGGPNNGDAGNNAQNIENLMGTLLRIDVDSELPYSVPEDNPFVGHEGADEIWAFGFRNPWRFSIDKTTGRLFLGDVGMSEREEVDLVEKGNNYGWRLMEGTECFNPSNDCNQGELALPIFDYSHDSGDGQSVTGGYVYRGSKLPSLFGQYIFGDYDSKKIFSLTEVDTNVWEHNELLQSEVMVTAFGEDEQGELYVVDHNAGTIHKIMSIEEALALAPTPTPDPTPVPTPTIIFKERFTFQCDRDLQKTAAGYNKLTLSLSETSECLLTITDLEANSNLEVETNLRKGMRASVLVIPEKGLTGLDGEIKFRIRAVREGVDWVSWAFENQDGDIEFSNKSYNDGHAWGMFVEIVE